MWVNMNIVSGFRIVGGGGWKIFFEKFKFFEFYIIKNMYFFFRKIKNFLELFYFYF